MLRGKLSDLNQRGRGISSTRSSRANAALCHGRRTKGGSNRRDFRSVKVDDETPLGPMITELKLVNPATLVGEARITNCSYAASYSVTEQKPYNLIVPGQPAAWKPLQMPCPLPSDNGSYVLDQNSACFPDHPMQPVVQSLFALDQTFDPSRIDIVGCASSMGDILRFVRSINSTFRFDVEMVGNTLFLIRSSKNNVIGDVRGYGHTFLDAFTSNDPADGAIKSHQRVVSYNFWGLKCLVRFECDGRLTPENQNATKPKYDVSSPLPPGSIPLRRGGVITPQECVIEIKTKAQARGAIDKNDHLPRLWIRQIPHFITAYHTQGSFENFKVDDVRTELVEWETMHQIELKQFGSILSRLITEVKRIGHRKLEVYRLGNGPLQVRERIAAAHHALPRVWEDRWIARHQHSHECSRGTDDSDYDSEPHSSPRSSSEESRSSEGDFAFDYTSCSTDCGYCGRCV